VTGGTAAAKMVRASHPNLLILGAELTALYTKLFTEGRFALLPGMAVRFLAPAEAAVERLRQTSLKC